VAAFGFQLPAGGAHIAKSAMMRHPRQPEKNSKPDTTMAAVCLTNQRYDRYNKGFARHSEDHTDMYAIFRTGGKQIKVSPGDVVRVEKLDGEPGSTVEFNHVLVVRRQELHVGAPLVDNAKVVGTIVRNDRAAKIRVLKYKRKKQYRRTIGHRQAFSEVRISEIVGG
jgi:large subunit ribosomal protein L21